MTIFDLEKKLRQKLSEKRPGFEAQKIMAPRLPDGTHFHNTPAPPDTRKNGVLVLLYPQEGETNLVFTVRTNHLPTHKGQISFPGGGFDTGEDAVQAALREAYEEINLNKSEVKIVGRLSNLYIPVSGNILTPVVAVCHVKPSLVASPGEVEQILTSPLEKFLSKNYVKEEVWRLQDLEIIVPFWNVFDIPLWGATAMVLSELVEVLKLEW